MSDTFAGNIRLALPSVEFKLNLDLALSFLYELKSKTSVNDIRPTRGILLKYPARTCISGLQSQHYFFNKLHHFLVLIDSSLFSYCYKRVGVLAILIMTC